MGFLDLINTLVGELRGILERYDDSRDRIAGVDLKFACTVCCVLSKPRSRLSKISSPGNEVPHEFMKLSRSE
jgi:hypothetical protein